MLALQVQLHGSAEHAVPVHIGTTHCGAQHTLVCFSVAALEPHAPGPGLVSPARQGYRLQLPCCSHGNMQHSNQGLGCDPPDVGTSKPPCSSPFVSYSTTRWEEPLGQAAYRWRPLGCQAKVGCSLPPALPTECSSPSLLQTLILLDSPSPEHRDIARYC